MDDRSCLSLRVNTIDLGSGASHVEETIEFVASLTANDRISVVQETYESALIMATGYIIMGSSNPRREMLQELEQAMGEPLPCRHKSSHSETTYESSLIMATGYNHGLLKSETEMLQELEQAMGEPLPCRHNSSHSEAKRRETRFAA